MSGSIVSAASRLARMVVAQAIYIRELLDGVEFRRTSYALDQESRQAAMDRLFEQTRGAVREAEAA